jgi:hypothetical protein
MFERYLALGSIRALEQELQSAGILTRRRELSTGKVIGAIPFTQGPLAHILKNRTYVGELNHLKKAYPADHPPIITRELFDAVQKQLEAKRNTRAEKHQASGALLIGKLFDQYGRPMTLPTPARVRGDIATTCRGPAAVCAKSRHVRHTSKQTLVPRMFGPGVDFSHYDGVEMRWP